MTVFIFVKMSSDVKSFHPTFTSDLMVALLSEMVLPRAVMCIRQALSWSLSCVLVVVICTASLFVSMNVY